MSHSPESVVYGVIWATVQKLTLRGLGSSGTTRHTLGVQFCEQCKYLAFSVFYKGVFQLAGLLALGRLYASVSMIDAVSGSPLFPSSPHQSH